MTFFYIKQLLPPVPDKIDTNLRVESAAKNAAHARVRFMIRTK